MLAIHADTQQQQDWASPPPLVLLFLPTYRTVSSTVEKSPFNTIVFGREAGMPIDIILGLPCACQSIDYHEYLRKTQENRLSAFEITRLAYSSLYDSLVEECPFNLLFGREAGLSMSIILGLPRACQSIDYHEFVRETQESLHLAFVIARINPLDRAAKHETVNRTWSFYPVFKPGQPRYCAAHLKQLVDRILN